MEDACDEPGTRGPTALSHTKSIVLVYTGTLGEVASRSRDAAEGPNDADLSTVVDCEFEINSRRVEMAMKVLSGSVKGLSETTAYDVAV